MNKKRLMVLAIAFFSLNNVMANEQENDSVEALSEAPKSIINEIKTDCKIWASEDEISTEKMPKYMLKCVNLELEMQGYKKLKKLA